VLREGVLLLFDFQIRPSCSSVAFVRIPEPISWPVLFSLKYLHLLNRLFSGSRRQPARVEGHEKAYMLEWIKVLGYLTLHTRQIDMIMTNSDKAGYYRSKIKKNIGKIINAPAVTGNS